jgi:hypothetical protein
MSASSLCIGGDEMFIVYLSTRKHAQQLKAGNCVGPIAANTHSTATGTCARRRVDLGIVSNFNNLNMHLAN